MFYGWVVVATCFLINTIAFGSAYSFGVFLNPLRETFSASSAAVSGAYSLELFLYTGLAVVWGLSVDRYGSRVTTMVGGALLFTGLLLTSRVSALWQLYVTYGLIGMGVSTSYSPLMATVSRWFDRQRGLAIGISSTGLGLGPVIMAPVASYLIAIDSWRFAYFVMAFAAALTIPAALLLKKSPHDTASLPHTGMPDSRVPPTTVKRDGASPETVDLPLKQAFRTRPFWLISLMFLLVGMALQIVIAHIVAYSQLKGISAMTAAAVLSTITGASIAGRIIWGSVSDRIGRKKTLAICVLTEGTMIIWLMGATSAWMLFLFAVIFGFGYGGHATQFPALTGEIFGLRHMGANLGGVVFFWGLGGAFGAAIAGHIFDVTGSYISAFILGAAGMLAAGAITSLVKRPGKTPAAG